MSCWIFFNSSDTNPVKGREDTAGLAKHLKLLLLTGIISGEVRTEICLRGKNQVKQETDFQEGTLLNESLRSPQEPHVWPGTGGRRNNLTAYFEQLLGVQGAGKLYKLVRWSVFQKVTRKEIAI